jgi:3',5'-cyclic AMP phosphodiesterase CpdA
MVSRACIYSPHLGATDAATSWRGDASGIAAVRCEGRGGVVTPLVGRAMLCPTARPTGAYVTGSDTQLRVLVVADLHCTTRPPGDDAGSWLTTTTPRTVRDHPLVGLAALLKPSTEIDLVLCAGDLCDKADPTALEYVWRELHILADALGAPLIATAGNHDLDSRHKLEIDPRGVLYDLEPPFPAGDAASRDEYWARNYVIVDAPARRTDPPLWRVVSLNSAAFHGYTADGSPELDHGRVSARTARRLEGDLAARSRARNSILLVHHHLEQLPDVDLDDRSQIQDADHLAGVLERTGPWLVVHGHKHHARVLYARGSGASATIFSAGSLAAYSFGQLSTIGGANQAYVLEFRSQEGLETLDLGLAITFNSWNWRPNYGWRPASTDAGLPGQGGFGWRTDPRRLSARLAKSVHEKGAPLDEAELLSLEPRLVHLAPRDVELLVQNLSTERPPISCKRDEHGRLILLGSRVEEPSPAVPKPQVLTSTGSPRVRETPAGPRE